jgi:wee1-like protein kinase
VKPDNIYFKNGVYKLGDFGCATLLDQSLPVEEGDARYMPQEILNENYNYLDKVDIFSLGAAIYELIRGSTLPQSGSHLFNLREGKLPLLPGHSLQLQNLLKVLRVIFLSTLLAVHRNGKWLRFFPPSHVPCSRADQDLFGSSLKS